MVLSSPIDFHDFHLLLLPERLASGNGLLAAQAARELEPLALRIRGTDNAYTYVPSSYGIDLLAGTETEWVVELDQDAWEMVVLGLESNADAFLLAAVADQSFDEGFLSRWGQVLHLMCYGV